MMNYVARRLLFAIPTLIAISILSFVIIQLPPATTSTRKSLSWSSSTVTLAQWRKPTNSASTTG